METLTIGKMAKINGISEQTLRLYDKMGLVVPCETNKDTGYRYYNIRQCAQLDMIHYLKSLNMTLAQIKECFESGSSQSLRDILSEQKVSIEEQIKGLKQADWAIERALESFQRYDVAPKSGIPIMEFQNERYVFLYDTEINCYSYGMDYYESVLRQLRQQYDLHHLPSSYFCNVGSILRKERFENKELLATEILLFVDDTFADREDIVTIPEGMYVCMYCDGFDHEEDAIRNLMNYVEENGYKVAGDCITEVLIEFPTFNEYDREAFLKLQVPVEGSKK